MKVITPQTTKAEKGARGEGFIDEEIKKKNSTIIYVHGLYKMNQIEDIKDSIRAIIRAKNVVSFFFSSQVGDLDMVTINV